MAKPIKYKLIEIIYYDDKSFKDNRKFTYMNLVRIDVFAKVLVNFCDDYSFIVDVPFYVWSSNFTDDDEENDYPGTDFGNLVSIYPDINYAVLVNDDHSDGNPSIAFNQIIEYFISESLYGIEKALHKSMVNGCVDYIEELKYKKELTMNETFCQLFCDYIISTFS